MSGFNEIQEKLNDFIKKFYTNELIKGVLLFVSFGLLYFMFTLFIEYFLWLKPVARTILFWIFIGVELALLVIYIVKPIFKLVGFSKGISKEEAANLIGVHFPEVSDKLLNMIQLNDTNSHSELIEASIEQKSLELSPIPFVKAVNFSKNKKYIKYALLPLAIWLVVYVTGNISIFNESLDRVVHHSDQFEPPAPYSFVVKNKSLDVVEGTSFLLEVETVGDVVPEDVKIFFKNEFYYLKQLEPGKFEYLFPSVKNNVVFNLQSNDVTSQEYVINLIETPVISNYKMLLKYPPYTGKKNEVIQNTGNVIVPEGTEIAWQIETEKTDKISFKEMNLEESYFVKNSNNFFSFSKKIKNAFNYKIATSNNNLKNHETLEFKIDVVSDEFPKIEVQSNIDSISRGPAQFKGELSDDFGISKLQIVCYDKLNPSIKMSFQIPISKSVYTDFYYIFPNGLHLLEGVNYEMYFEVFDNDAVNGSKNSKSRTFSYYVKNEREVEDAILFDQKENMDAILKDLKISKEATKDLDKFNNELQKKGEMNWNDSKKIQDLLKRQNEYQKMFEDKTKKLEENFKEQTPSPSLKEKKEEIQKRIEEAKKLAEKDKMLKELEELTKKLNKEDLVEKLKDIAEKNKRKEKSLERILELTKRFYVEQKQEQLKNKLSDLAKKEDALSNKEDLENTSKKQEEINKEFDEIKKDFKELEKENNDLMRPMDIPDFKNESKDIQNDLDKASEDLKKNDKNNASKNQKAASKKMKKLSESMEKAMSESDGESMDEDIDDLRKIVENLIEFSFQQESLMNGFSKGAVGHPSFPKNLKRQQVLKEYFEHIDDSLYVLSLRLAKLGGSIQKEVEDVYYNIDASLDNFTDDRYSQGISNQQFVITATNNLANSLSNVLESLMNASMSIGKGKGKGDSPGFSLPDIIKKQGELQSKMEKGSKEGEKGEKGEKGKNGENGEGKGNSSDKNGDGENEGMNKELFELYKEQAELRQALQDLLGKEEGGKNGNGQGKKAVTQMEAIEKMLLEKGFSGEVLQNMKQLSYELLKLEKAKLEQGEDTKRKSESNLKQFQNRFIDSLDIEKWYFNNNEILNRQSLPLRTIYKKKVQEYFKTIE